MRSTGRSPSRPVSRKQLSGREWLMVPEMLVAAISSKRHDIPANKHPREVSWLTPLSFPEINTGSPLFHPVRSGEATNHKQNETVIHHHPAFFFVLAISPTTAMVRSETNLPNLTAVDCTDVKRLGTGNDSGNTGRSFLVTWSSQREHMTVLRSSTMIT